MVYYLVNYHIVKQRGNENVRNLKYAILGLLSQHSMTGYELMQKFEESLSEFWSAKHSQIYPELKRLTDEGAVEYEVQIAGTVLEKKVYTLTENGRKDFAEWLKRDEPMQETPKDVFRLRLFFASELEPEVREKLIESQLAQHRDRLLQLKQNQKKFDGMPENHTSEFSDYLILLGAVMREETHCRWLETCLELCNNTLCDAHKMR